MPEATHAQEDLYPATEATHEQVVHDRELFKQTLEHLLSHLSIGKPKNPKVGGAEVDLHLLYREVTSLGGLETVTARKQWVQVCEPFNFPASFTNKSYVIKKLYINALHHYEQLYFHRRQGPLVPLPAIQAVAPAGGAPKKRRAVCKPEPMAAAALPRDCGGVDAAAPVVVMPDGPSSNSGSTTSAFKDLEAGTRFTGIIDSSVGHGYRITIHLPGQCLQGVLYRQAPSDGAAAPGPALVPAAAAAAAAAPARAVPSNGQRSEKAAAATPTVAHMDEGSDMSQELESRHPTHSALVPFAGRPPMAPPLADLPSAMAVPAAMVAAAGVPPPHAPSSPALMLQPPRPARTPYQFFQLGVNKDQLLQLHPGLTAPIPPRELLPRLMAELWQQMTPEQHRPFLSMAARDRERFEREWEEHCRRLAEVHADVHGDGSCADVRTPGPPAAAPPPRMAFGQPVDPAAAAAALDHHRAMQHSTAAGSHQHLPHLPLAPAPYYRQQPRRMCMGVPTAAARPHLAAPQPAPLHPGLKVRIPSAPAYLQPQPRYPAAAAADGSSGDCGGGGCQPLAASGGSSSHLSIVEDLLPPDMELEDLEHLCHYQDDSSQDMDHMMMAAAAYPPYGPRQGASVAPTQCMDLGGPHGYNKEAALPPGRSSAPGFTFSAMPQYAGAASDFQQGGLFTPVAAARGGWRGGPQQQQPGLQRPDSRGAGAGTPQGFPTPQKDAGGGGGRAAYFGGYAHDCSP